MARDVVGAYRKADVISRDLLRDVPDVARRRDQMIPRWCLAPARELGGERVAESEVRLDREVRPHLVLHVHLCPGLEGSALGHIFEPIDHFLQGVHVRCTDAEIADGARRDNVRGEATLPDDSVDSSRRRQVLAPAVDRDEERDERGQRGLSLLQRDRWARRPDACSERGREAAEVTFHNVAVLLEERGYSADRAMLLISEFRIGVDLAGEPDQIVAEAVGAHFVIRSRSEPSVATRTAAAPSASAVIMALRWARSLMLASRI